MSVARAAGVRCDETAGRIPDRDGTGPTVSDTLFGPTKTSGMSVTDDLFEAVFRPPCAAVRLAAAGASPIGFAGKLVELLGLRPRQVMATPDGEAAATRCWIVALAADQGQPDRRVARVVGINAEAVNRALADLADRTAFEPGDPPKGAEA